VTLALVAEDEGHVRVVTTLVDAALLDGCAWLDGVLEYCRRWRGLEEGEAWSKHRREDAQGGAGRGAGGRPDRPEIRPHGHIQGEPLKSNARETREILSRFQEREPRPDVLILARDLDGRPERLEGIDQVRRGLDWSFRVVVAAPQPEVEAWVVSGFEAADEGETRALRGLCEALSFDPTREAHRLTSRPSDVPTDAKRVLAALTGGDEAREGRCLADRSRLRERDRGNGVTAFLDEVDTVIVPLFRPGDPRRS
jgi:hypothetical protein